MAHRGVPSSTGTSRVWSPRKAARREGDEEMIPVPGFEDDEKELVPVQEISVQGDDWRRAIRKSVEDFDDGGTHGQATTRSSE